MKRLLLATLLAGCALDPNPNPELPDFPRPPNAVDVTMEFCDVAPAWFAFQNEGYDWVLFPPFTGQSVFTFPAGPRLTVLTADAGGPPSFSISAVTVRYMTAAEADAFRCSPSTFGQSTVSAAIATEANDDLTLIEMGGVSGFTQGSTTFTLEGLANHSVLDLIALNRFVSATDEALAPRVIVRNNVVVTDDVVVPALDFTSAEAQPLGTVQITRADGGAPDAGFSQYESANKTRLPLVFVTAVSAGGTLRLPFVPAALLKGGDLHRFDVQTADRGLTYWQPLPRDTAIAFGPVLAEVILDTVSAAPLQQRVRFASQPEYPAYAEVVFRQSTASASRSVEVITSAAYLGGVPAQWELVMPDLHGIVPPAWLLSNTTTVSFTVTARNARPELYNGLVTPAAGETMAWASKQGQ